MSPWKNVDAPGAFIREYKEKCMYLQISQKNESFLSFATSLLDCDCSNVKFQKYENFTAIRNNNNNNIKEGGTGKIKMNIPNKQATHLYSLITSCG